MRDEDFIVMIAFVVAIGAGCFFGGKSTGDDYWHKDCKDYSVAAYKAGEYPARCPTQQNITKIGDSK